MNPSGGYRTTQGTTRGSARGSTLVTGASSGIGGELARQLAAAGRPVLALGRNRDLLQALAQAHPGLVTPVLADLAELQALPGLASRLRSHRPALDCVIHNACVQQALRFDAEGYGPAQIEVELAVNLTAPVLLTHALLPHLLAQPRAELVFVTSQAVNESAAPEGRARRRPIKAQSAAISRDMACVCNAERLPSGVDSGCGWFVHSLSGLAYAPKRNAAVYCASNAGLQRFAQALRVQMRTGAVGTHLRVVEAVMPLIDTPMSAGRSGRLRKWPADRAAAAVLQGLARGRRDTLHVGPARALPWLQRLSPTLLAHVLQRG